MSAIRRYVRQIVEEFQPEKVILFGSYARGDQREGSDVDLLVVMPARSVVSQAIRIRLAVRAPFAMDLIVRTPEQLRQRIADGNWFLREITETGVVLYAKRNRGVDQKGRSRLRRSLTSLSQYAVDFRYPDMSSTTRQSKSALRATERIRKILRLRLGLPK